MATITKELIQFCAEAYSALKDDESKKACHIKYRKDDEKHISYVMQKQSWYFGDWALFKGDTYVGNIDEQLLQEWSQK